MKKGVLVTCGLIFSLGLATAQNSLMFDLNIIKPRGDFAEKLNGAVPGGFGFTYTRAVKGFTNLEWGLSAGVSMYAYREYEVTFTPKNSTEQKTVKVNEDDCFIQYSGMMRFLPFGQGTMFQPYISANVGRNRFFSHIDPLEDNSGYESKFRWQGLATYGGVGLGLRMDMNRVFGNKSAVIPFIVDISNTWNSGAVTTYRYFRHDEAPHENLTYGLHKTKTSNSTFRMGFGFVF